MTNENYTISKAAELIKDATGNCHHTTVRNWIKSGFIPKDVVFPDPLKRRGKGNGTRISKTWVDNFCKKYQNPTLKKESK